MTPHQLHLLSEMTRANKHGRSLNGLRYAHPDCVAQREWLLRLKGEWEAEGRRVSDLVSTERL